ncbi:nitroreductase family protein [candidate division CSSED10-310 bacterium]|uniref:Nitroreductase family protein n=1 Tax=candidate division CSSED10-310 bacterium TaxID=2855610 RepID=A0ABV6YUR9_UNCC1
MSDLFHIIKQRRSIRRYKSIIPEMELLKELIESAIMAPNAMNRQDWQFTILLSGETKEAISQAVERTWNNLCQEQSAINDAIKAYMGNFTTFINAPVLMAVDVKKPPIFLETLLKEKTIKVMGSYASACLAVQNLLLAATAKGLGTCVYTGCMAAEQEIVRILGIPKQRELVCLIAIGYPAEQPKTPPRKDLEKVVRII